MIVNEPIISTSSSSTAFCEQALPFKYQHHTYFCHKAELLRSGLKRMATGVITGT